MKKKGTKKGFTLIELIIVAVFASLLIILFFVQKSNIDAMQQAAQGGPAQPAQPAMPAPPAGAAGAPQMEMPFNEGNSPSAAGEQLFEQANQIAQQLYNAPEAVRRSELAKLKSSNWQLHAQVTQMLKDMRQQVASEAVMQSQQPQG